MADLDLTQLKADSAQALHALAAGAGTDQVFAPDAVWEGCHPFNTLTGPAAIGAAYARLHAAFDGLTRHDDILVAGDNLPDPRVTNPRPETLVATMGRYTGQFTQAFCGIPPTGQTAHLRACEVHVLHGTRIVQSWVLWDLIDLMRQAGVWPLPRSLGIENAWGPAPGGLRMAQTDGAKGARSMEHVLRMHAALGHFDGKTLASMPHAQYWTPDFGWYGPAGIGTTKGMTAFQTNHQLPFLHAFPDRRGAGHFIRIGDGDYAVTGGWPSVTGTHLGEFLGMAPTGRRIEMRVMDFYRLDGDQIADNWVPIDILYMAHQMGVDLLARVQHYAGSPRREVY